MQQKKIRRKNKVDKVLLGIFAPIVSFIVHKHEDKIDVFSAIANDEYYILCMPVLDTELFDSSNEGTYELKLKFSDSMIYTVSVFNEVKVGDQFYLVIANGASEISVAYNANVYQLGNTIKHKLVTV